MLTLQRTRGVAGSLEYIAAIRRAVMGGYEPGGVEWADRPDVVCEVWPGGSLPVAAVLPVTWDATTDGLLAIESPEAVMSALAVGRWQARVRTTGDNTEVARFELLMIPGPGSGEARPAYHSYEDLLREWPAIEKFADDLNDQTGFAATAAEARDWIDARITQAARRAPCSTSYYQGGLYATPQPYIDAIAGEYLILDSPEGRKIVRASVYRTLAVLLRRIDGMTAQPDQYIEKRQDYERWAEAELDGLWVAFAPEADLRPLRLGGGMTVGRVTR